MTTATNPSIPTSPRLRLQKAIPSGERKVVRRDGQKSDFGIEKIIRAVALAYYEVRNNNAPNAHREDASAYYGLNKDTYRRAEEVSRSVERMLEIYYQEGKHPTIEQIQDAVEKSIAAAGDWDVARAYVLYRANHANNRSQAYQINGLGDYIAQSKYARYRPDLQRREVFSEGVDRVRDMHLAFFKDKLKRKVSSAIDGDEARLAGANLDLLRELLGGRDLEEMLYTSFYQVSQKRILPSMRSMQFGGDAVLKNEARLYNCSFSNVDRVEFFREYLFLLLCGCGVGFSVQRHHVALLPALPHRAADEELPVQHFTIPDTIEGWADALHALFKSYYDGTKIEFNYSFIRPKGAALRTSGGKAPGHRPLKKALERVEAVLAGASGRHLRPFEIYEMCMFTASAVLAGGIRRSATICLFSPDDDEMTNAKSGDWYSKHKHREASNNSSVIPRGEDQRANYNRLFEAQKQFGEPGFYFCDNPDAGANPCVEIALYPVLKDPTPEEIAKLYSYGYQGEIAPGQRLSGFQFCNLTTIAGGAAKTGEDFLRACVWAAFIGTCQAAYTDIPYLGPITRVINEREALLGVSICGFMDNPELLFDENLLTAGARLCRATNRLVARLLGISHAARITCVKPEGTASLLLDSGSGIHPHHARRYFRRVRASRDENVFKFFKSVNPQMTERAASRGDTDDMITFPVEAPAGAILRKDIGAIKFLDMVKLVQQSWVREGASEDTRFPDISHNVSNTCTVRQDEWAEVREYIWSNRALFTGIALLQESGDKGYTQAPREEVVDEGDVAKWNLLKPEPVDYTQMVEAEDNTALKQAVACAGGACEVV